MVIILAIIIPNAIAISLSALNFAIQDLIKTRDISTRIKISSNDEIAAVSSSFNDYLQTLEDGIKQDQVVIDAVKNAVEIAKTGMMKQHIDVSTQNKGLEELNGISPSLSQVISQIFALLVAF